jgi:hypothetical protein
MSSKFSRFLHLERSRGERSKPEEPSRLQTGHRFEGLAERGAAPSSAAVPETHLERFRGEVPLALADAPSGEERFPRCARCESDNSRFAQACGACGADLNTPQQREYNERFWQSRRAQERELAQAQEQLRLQAEAQRQEELAHRHRLAEQLRADPWGNGRAGGLFRGRSPGMFLLGLIPSRPVRWGVGAGLVSVPFLIARFGSPGWQLLAWPIGVLLLVLFLPPSILRQRSR